MNTVYDAASAAKKTRIWQMQSDGSWMDVSSWFTIEADADSNTISAAAKDSTISEDNEVDFFGHTYYMVICTEIKSSVTMERLAALVKDDKNNITYSSSLYVIPNSASCTAGVYNPYDQTYAQATYKEETNESNTVYVHFTEPSLSIVKTVDGASSVEVSKGDTVHYLITVKQTTKGATAQNIVVQDVSLKNSGTIVIDADSVTAKVGSTVYSSGVTVKDNTVSFALSKLAYGQTVTIAYDAVVKKAVSRLANTAAAVADDTDMVTATAVVSAGEPGLAVEKYVSKDYSASGNDTSNYQNGDYADYQIVVYSADGNAAARNVVLTDAWDAGLSVLDDTVQVYYTTNASNYTDTSKAVKLTQGTDYTISAVSSRKYAIAFQGAYADLGGDGFGAYLITYSAKVASTGTSSITTLTNTATASSDNTEDVSAAASISLSNLPKASITKEVDVEEAALGDSITYTVTLTNTGGVSLEDWSLYDTSVNGTAFDGFTLQSVTAAYYHNISGAVYGWESLYSGDNDWYFSYPGTRGWKLFCGSALSDTLGVGEAIRVTAVYTTDRAAATDTRIVNTACYSATGRNSSNTIEGEAAATVRLVKPVLKLTKTSDADTYSDSNSMATYTLTVEQDDAQERKDMTAYNVMINDALPASARFTGSYTVKKVGTDGSATDITKQSSGGAGYSCSISGDALARTSVLTETAGSSRFLGIDTGADLAYGEKLIITYTVSLANAASSVETVTNTATAEALNADEVQTTHTVQMTMPVLAVTKSADKGTYALGDTATYYVRITQTEDAEAYEITCKDFIDPTEIPLSGAFYNAIHDIVVTDSSGTVLTKNTDYTIVSYRSSTENGMELYFDESLSLAQGESFTIAYQVDLTDEAWLTQTNENTVQASAWNADSVSATADMLVEKAQLAISKTVDAYEYERGDTAVFTVSVTAVAKADVEDLVLRDMIDNTSVSAQWFEESLQALAVYDTDGIALSEDMYTVTYLGGGYVLSFEEPLSYGESYTVEYAVLLHDSGLWNVDTVNTATANASNAERVSAAATVTVTATPYTEVRITKKILAADINFANGDPMFVFHLTGTDKTGQEISLRRVIDFTEEYVEKHTDADGYVQLTAVFETLLPGVYTVSEDKTLRYRFQDIVSVSPYGAVNGETVVFDVSAVTEDVTVFATFRNEKEEWQFYTDTDIAVNQFHTDAAE